MGNRAYRQGSARACQLVCLCTLTSPRPKQVKKLQSAQSTNNRADLQAQIAQLAAGTIELAEGQAISAASLEKVHEKTNMLAAAFQKQQECIKVGIQPFLRTATGVVVCTQTMQRIGSSGGLRS